MAPSKNMSPIPPFGAGPEIQKLIAAATDAVLKLFLHASRCGDPVVATLLGVSDEVLVEFEQLSLAEMLPVAAFGAPIFTMRFSDPAIIRTLFKSGFSSEAVLREVT